VLDGRGVIAATTSARVGVALTKAVLEDTDIRSISTTPGGIVPGNEVVPAVRKHPGTVANTCVGGASDG
jgi:hypothetical protein